MEAEGRCRSVRQQPEDDQRFRESKLRKYSLTSLKKLASVFDVALVVRFAPFSELVDWATTISEDKLAVPERKRDARLRQQRATQKAEAETTAREGFDDVPTNATVQSSTNTEQAQDERRKLDTVWRSADISERRGCLNMARKPKTRKLDQRNYQTRRRKRPAMMRRRLFARTSIAGSKGRKDT